MSPEAPVPHTVATQLGLNLQRLRALTNQNQTETARRAGIARGHYNALEAGKSSNGSPANPRLSTLLNLAAALDSPLADVLHGLLNPDGLEVILAVDDL